MRIVTGPYVTAQVRDRNTGAPAAGVAVAVSSTVYTDRELSSGATTALTADGDGVVKFYAAPGTYTFTVPAGVTTPEPVEVLSSGQGTRGNTTLAPLQENVNTVTSSGAAVTLPDVDGATMHKVTLTANCTITLPAPGAGKSLTVEVNQDATGSRTLAFATPSGAIQWAGGAAPTWSTAASKRDVVTFVCIGGTNWIGSALLDVR